MSQYPGQFPPSNNPGPYEPPRLDYLRSMAGDPLRPARRASLIMVILGAIGLAFGVLLRMLATHVPDDVVQQVLGNLPPNVPKPSIAELREKLQMAGMGTAIIGAMYAILGLLVRSGRKPVTIVAICTSGLGIAWMALGGISALATGGSSGVCTLIMVAALVAVFVLVIRFLLQSLATTRDAAAYQQQWAMQQAYYYHQRQAAQQSSSIPPPPPGTIPDYNLPPPHPNPPAPPPQPPNS